MPTTTTAAGRGGGGGSTTTTTTTPTASSPVSFTIASNFVVATAAAPGSPNVRSRAPFALDALQGSQQRARLAHAVRTGG
jgi:hypothetical protein